MDSFRHYMSRDEAGFDQTAQANPDDDTTLHVFADYLEERGDPRGQAIRLLLAIKQDPNNRANVAKLIKLQKARRGPNLLQSIESIPTVKHWLAHNGQLLRLIRPSITYATELRQILPLGEPIEFEWDIFDHGDYFLVHNSLYNDPDDVIEDDEGNMLSHRIDFVVTIPKNRPTDFRIDYPAESPIVPRLIHSSGIHEYLVRTIRQALNAHLRTL